MVFRGLAVILFLLCGVAGSALANNPSCSPSADEDGITLHYPYAAPMRKSEAVREEGTDVYKPGPWLALACTGKRCRLVRVQLQVKTIQPAPPPEDGSCAIYQVLRWDLSPLGEGENAVMMFQLDPALTEGNVLTWYVGKSVAQNYTFTPFFERKSPVTASVRIPTPARENPKRASLVSTCWVTSPACSEQQAADNECMRNTVRVQLREGRETQWLTRPWKGSPSTANCMDGMTVEGYFNRDYLLWVGDLDGDHKPDYLLWNADADEYGYTLYLSSKAGPGQLVAKAGRHWADMPCD